ncbi:hypothetical protein ABZX01_003793 [Vibrio vulnificus]
MKNKVVHSVDTELTLNDENFNRIFSDHKCTSVRLGNKDIHPGLAHIKNEKTGQVLPVNIWYVNHCLLSDLELNDARLDGFATMEDLKSELRRCYQRPISDREVITQVHFDVVKEESVA